jgi:hypothetical protein
MSQHQSRADGQLQQPGGGTQTPSPLGFPDGSLADYPSVLRTYTATFRSGSTETFETWLLGVDSQGHGVYFDERNRCILRVSPEGSFESGDVLPEHIVSEYVDDSVSVAPATGTDGATFVEVWREQISVSQYQPEQLLRWIVAHAGPTRDVAWVELSDRVLRLVHECRGRLLAPAGEALKFLTNQYGN